MFKDKMINRMMAVMALWLIEKRERSGYEIMKVYREEGMPHMAAASRIYPLLARMEKDGLVKRKLGKGRRTNYVYTITKKGESTLKNVSAHISAGLRGKFLREMLAGGRE